MWMIYIFKDEFKYVIEKKGRMMAACDMDIITLDSETGRAGLLVCATNPTPGAL